MTPITDSEGRELRDMEDGVEYVWCVDSAGRQRRVPAAEVVVAEGPEPEVAPEPQAEPEEVLTVEVEPEPEPAEVIEITAELLAEGPEEDAEEDAEEVAPAALWPVMPAPAWQYTLAGRCAWAVGAVWLAPLPCVLAGGAALLIGSWPAAEVCAVGATVAPWVAIALHERAARRAAPWRAIAGADGAPVVREGKGGRRWIRAERGGERRWIDAEQWSWAPEGGAEGAGIAGRVAGAVQSHLPALLGGHDSTADLLAQEAAREDRREARAEEALRLRREAQEAAQEIRRGQLALAEQREARLAARGGARR